MKMTATTLRSFLQFLKDDHFCKLTSSSILKIVIGNEAADFDSVACALVYAFCSYQRDPQDPLVPVINIPRNEFPLRRDIVRALKRLNITDDLLFFNEEFRHYKKIFGSINAILVDHNEVTIKSDSLINKVAGIIDHHKDQKLFLNAEPRIVQTSGSCSSLVFNYWSFVISKCVKEVSRETALLCLGASLLDTSNFKYRVVEQDMEALNSCLKILPNVDREEYYRQLRNDKDDLEGMNIKDILKKDYKEFTFQQAHQKIRIGISSVNKPLQWLKKRYGKSGEFELQYIEAQTNCKVDIFAVMTAWGDSEDFKRELIVFSPERQRCECIMNKISSELKLENLQGMNINIHDPNAYLGLFKQRNLWASRKQVVPLLEEAFQSVATGK